MPLYSFLHWTNEEGHTLQRTGPITQVEIAMPGPLREVLGAKGDIAPPPRTGLALIDTGAFATAVDEAIFRDLGVSPIDVIETQSTSGSDKSNVYPAEVSFPDLGLREIPLERVVGVNLGWPVGSGGKNVIMLLGRDLLKYFLLLYNGPRSDITLAW